MDKMTELFLTRTRNHISTVNYYAGLIDMNFSNHDASKYSYPETDAYILLTWSKANPDFVLTNDKKRAIKKAVKHHCLQNLHHPEKYKFIAKMQENSIIEMVCDWCAMTAEGRFGNKSIKHLDTRAFYWDKALPKYNFTEQQHKLITNLIAFMDKKQNLIEVEKIWTR